MRALLTIALVMLPALAGAAPKSFVFEWRGMPYSVSMPPEKYETAAPLAPVEVHYEPLETVMSDCSLAREGEEMGCALLSPSFCIVVINRDLQPGLMAAVLKHETAHCKGWPGDHPIH